MTARIQNVSRRRFLQGLGAGSGFALAFTLPGVRALAAGAQTGSGRDPFNPNAFVFIAESGDVTLVVHRSEMGQGIRSTLAMVLADELEADWARTTIRQAKGDEKTYGSQNTDGSHSVRDFLVPLRQMAATARVMLERAAADSWKVPVAEVQARQHQVVHTPTGRALGFGALVAAARALPVPPVAEIALKPVTAMRAVGKKIPFADGPAMTTGRAVYGIDARLPGMAYAVIARPPVVGGRVGSVDATETLKVAGVERIAQLDGVKAPFGFTPLGGVAVIARNTWAAMEGRERLKVTWDDGANAVYDSTTYRTALEASVRKPGRVARNEGDVDAALASAARTVSAEYYIPHLAHAPMEPPAALASVTDGKCEVWACTQHPQAARDEVAKALGIPVADVTVHVTFLGGGFGRKSKPDYVVEAALLSREAGRPIKVTWTREDDIRHDYFHAVAAERIEAGLDATGRVTAWRHRTAFPSIFSLFQPGVAGPVDFELALGHTDMPFAVPNVRCEACEAPVHARIGWFRSVCNIQHAFAVCSFADELAHAVTRDPRAFLLDLIGPPRHIDLTAAGVKDWNYNGDPKVYPLDTGRLRRVIELATEQAGWGRKLPRGRGLGLAVHRSFLAYVATVVEVAVDREGTISVPRVVTAIDCGFPANPDRIRAQMEGSAVMGMGLALHGQVTFKGGRAVQGNFDDFPIARIDNAPRHVDVHIVASDEPPGGVGEPGLPPFAPALCNAIFAATGTRIRQLPIGDRVKV